VVPLAGGLFAIKQKRRGRAWRHAGLVFSTRDKAFAVAAPLAVLSKMIQHSAALVALAASFQRDRASGS